MVLLQTVRTIVLAGLILLPGVALGQSVAEHISLGDQEQAAFNPAAALVHYEAAIALAPDNGEALGKASRTAVDVGEQTADAAKRNTMFRTGEQYARRAVEASPNDPEVHFHLARALGRTALTLGVRDRVKYATDIRARALQALKLDPDHPGALHVLGVWNAEIMRLSGVERFFARKVLGGQVFSEASWKEAIAMMERAVAVDPRRLTHRLDLAKIYLDVGEKEKARAMFEAVVRGPRTEVHDPAYKAEAEAALRKLK
jgi:FimV-like protein